MSHEPREPEPDGTQEREPMRWGVLVHEVRITEVHAREARSGGGGGGSSGGSAGAGGDVLTLTELANACECHPDQVRAWLQVGVIDAAGRRGDQLLFRRQATTRLARALRLRQDLGIGVHALGLVLDLLERVDALEAELRRRR